MTSASVQQETVPVRNEADIAVVIMKVRQFADQLHLDEVRTWRLATVASELATNIVKYATRGTLTLCVLHDRTRDCAAIIAEDKGPGIPDVALALQEHYSSSGSLGLGLGGAKRLMDTFDIQTASGCGCRITARMWLDG